MPYFLLKPKLRKSITATSDTLLLRNLNLYKRIIIIGLMCIRKILFKVALSLGLTSDTLDIPTGLAIVISITFAKKPAIIQ